MNPAAAHAMPLRLPAWRSRAVLLSLLLAFAVLAGRAIYLQGLHNNFLQQKGELRYGRVIELPATRGIITDRNREPLAISTPVESVWASAADIEITSAQKKRLAQLVELDSAEIDKRLADTKRDFVYLKRHLPPEQAAKVVELNIPGVFLQREYHRYYPGSEYTAHLIGFTDIDDRGQEGLELAFDEQLSGKPGSRRVIKDRLGHIIEDVGSIRTPQQGRDLTLSIDAKLQYLAYRELKNAVDANRAKAGGIVVLDARTGEVLAMANLPSYNPNNRGKFEPRRTRNRAVTDLFEPGSTLKPFTAAAAIETGLFKFDSVIQTGSGQLSIGSATIHDAHPSGALTVAQVIQKSSNVGAAKIALALPSEKMWNMFNQVGFGTPPRSGFPGEGTGKLRAYASWRPIEQATMAYGHGISLSLLQLARAYMVFASDGEIKAVTLVKRDTPAASTRVITPETALQVRRMLELVVQPGGTAPRALVMGYRVAGKTGTAHKLEGANYAANKYVASFIGFAPASDPQLIIAVMIDEPGAGQYYGGTIAAPVFSNVMAGALRLLGVKPDAPLNNVVLPPPNTPEIREEV
jgi:cell division protein FtsI (penicillin-binding protein 3)